MSRRWTKKQRQERARKYRGRQVAPQATGQAMARLGNTSPQKHGLDSKVVQWFRRLDRKHLADPQNVPLLELVEEARVRAVEYVVGVMLTADDPEAKMKGVDFVQRQIRFGIRRFEAHPLLKGNRWA